MDTTFHETTEALFSAEKRKREHRRNEAIALLLRGSFIIEEQF